MSDFVQVGREPPIATVLLDRPQQLNALSEELMAELVSALQELDADTDIHCIVVGGHPAESDLARLGQSTCCAEAG